MDQYPALKIRLQIAMMSTKSDGGVLKLQERYGGWRGLFRQRLTALRFQEKYALTVEVSGKRRGSTENSKGSDYLQAESSGICSRPRVGFP